CPMLVVDGQRRKVARLHAEVAGQVCALIVIVEAGSEAPAAAHAPPRQKISPVADPAPVRQRAPRAVVCGPGLPRGVFKVIKIGWKRVVVIELDQARDAGCVFAIGGEKKSLEGCNGGEAAVKFPWSLAQMKAANDKAIDSKRSVADVFIDKRHISF